MVRRGRPSAKRGALRRGSRGNRCFRLPLAACPPLAGSRPAFGPAWFRLAPRSGEGPAGRAIKGQPRQGAAGAARAGVESCESEAGVPRAKRGARLPPLPLPHLPVSSETGGPAAARPARRGRGAEPALVPCCPLPPSCGSSAAQRRAPPPPPSRFPGCQGR